MKMLARAGALLCAFLMIAATPDALAQTKKLAAPSGTIPLTGICYGADGAASTCVDGSNPLPVGGVTVRPTATFTRPADTTAYASGDLVANSTTAGSVTPMTFAIGRSAGLGGMIRKARLRKSGTGVSNASFRLHLYSAAPTVTNGDNGAWLSSGAATYVGCFDITVDKAFSDGAAGNGTPCTGSEINFTATTYYGLLEARGAYTPASGETFELLLEVLQN